MLETVGWEDLGLSVDWWRRDGIWNRSRLLFVLFLVDINGKEIFCFSLYRHSEIAIDDILPNAETITDVWKVEIARS